ncbi:DUF6198 family protein [Selenomonadales bacterium OttesenSCG-928-I06]|nr:DUF6198 family protein [Selenomonadales bacterium OttesenSCG-928-I06]
MQKDTIKRCIYFVCGLFLTAFGVALIAKVNLGNAPIATLPYVLSLIFSVTLGVTTIAINVLFVLLQIILLQGNFPKVQYLQFVVAIFFGLFIDMSLFLITSINPETYILKMITLCIAGIIMSFGISIQVKQDLILMSGEALVKVISTKLSKEFGAMKVAFDVSIVAASIILSLIFLGSLEGVREGTIILAFSVGVFIRFFLKKFNSINKKIEAV